MNSHNQRFLAEGHKNGRLRSIGIAVLNAAKAEGLELYIDPKKTGDKKIGFSERGKGAKVVKGKPTVNMAGRSVKLSAKGLEIIEAVVARRPDWSTHKAGTVTAKAPGKTEEAPTEEAPTEEAK